MSNFWDLNDGSKVETTTEFDSGGGAMMPIPNDTGCIAAIEEAKWDEFNDDRFISLKWRIMKPSEFDKRVVYQKVKVYGLAKDKDPRAVADKAKRMLAAIDTNAGGKLMKVKGEPTDTDLMSALVGKVMAIKVMVWESTGDDGVERSGNWVSAVAPAKGAKQVEKKPEAKQEAKATDDDFDDDIPF